MQLFGPNLLNSGLLLKDIQPTETDFRGKKKDNIWLLSSCEILYTLTSSGLSLSNKTIQKGKLMLWLKWS